MKPYNEELLEQEIHKAIHEQNHFWWGCIIGMQYGKLSLQRVSEDEELSYCVDTEEQKEKTFQPIVRIKYGSPYEGDEKVGHLVSWYDENHMPVNVAYLRYKPEPVVFETGAKHDFINSLVLFCDNTSNLVDLRDEIYENHKHETELKPEIFVSLCDAARLAYLREVEEEGQIYFNIDKMRFKKNYQHVKEFCQIYVDDFERWKIEHP